MYAPLADLLQSTPSNDNNLYKQKKIMTSYEIYDLKMMIIK